MKTFKPFIYTGWYAPTLTTSEDPWLKAIEYDNGVKWKIAFEVGDECIGSINLEHPTGYEIHDSVKTIPVYTPEGKFLGSVYQRLEYSINMCIW
jgi:hypothetical protein